MKLFPRILMVAAVLLGLSFLVPHFEEDPPTLDVALTAVNLDASSQQLFLRTKEHDYEFALPPNQLNAAFAAGNCELGVHGVKFDQAGNATTSIEVACGGPKPCPEISADCYHRVLRSTLSDGERMQLRGQGFSPADHFGATAPMGQRNPGAPSLYMVWKAEHVAGQRHPSGSRNIDGTRDLRSFSDSTIYVTLDDPALFRRNRMLNEFLRPLAEFKFYVLQLIMLPILWLTGFWPGG
ncbi:hypothetical protein [Pseudomonas sp. SCB32]|uniref:hypothetical protein n=1 Tax=Pseudomonas sp. SCB32 TaxID=2653853 RepID=UPI00126435A1|nr:hypothetical protein [Pseudomonas sp. SCB32]